MESRKFATNSEEETIALGRRLAPELSGVVLLIGDLGAGKTTLAKGIVEGSGAAEVEAVSSPTYTLIHEYAGNVHHVDLYRLDEEREVARLGLEELFDRGGLILLEWAERFPRLLPANRTEIRLRRTGDGLAGILPCPSRVRIERMPCGAPESPRSSRRSPQLRKSFFAFSWLMCPRSSRRGRRRPAVSPLRRC